MSIVRIKHDKSNPYVILNKHALSDPNLSWGAKGLWAYLLSKPDHWEIRVCQLATIFTGKGGRRDAIRGYLGELITNKYAQRFEIREKGRISHYDYEVYEHPTAFKEISPQPDLPGPVQTTLVSNVEEVKKEKIRSPIAPKHFKQVDPAKEKSAEAAGGGGARAIKKEKKPTCGNPSLRKPRQRTQSAGNTTVAKNAERIRLAVGVVRAKGWGRGFVPDSFLRTLFQRFDESVVMKAFDLGNDAVAAAERAKRGPPIHSPGWFKSKCHELQNELEDK